MELEIIYFMSLPKIIKLSKPEVKFLQGKIKLHDQLIQNTKQIEFLISQLIDLICAQNSLKGEWQLDLENGQLIRKEEENA